MEDISLPWPYVTIYIAMLVVRMHVHVTAIICMRGASFFENRFIMLVLSVVIALASSNIIGGLALGESEYLIGVPNLCIEPY